MKPLFTAVFCSIALVIFCHGRAAATTEFCPAIADVAPVTPSAGSSQTYGLQLRALSDRQVSARVAFDTSAGWFQVDVPQTPLSGSVRTVPLTYPVDIPLAVSPIVDVRFPSAVHMNRAFVISATSVGDEFHWSDRGRVSCTPNAESWADPNYSLADLSGLAALPAGNATTLTATPRAPLERSACAQPFSAAKVVKQANTQYPEAAKDVGASGTSVVAVAVDPDNTIADSWIQGSADDATLDAGALATAQASTFQAAHVYCQAVPSIFYLTVTFKSGQ